MLVSRLVNCATVTAANHPYCWSTITGSIHPARRAGTYRASTAIVEVSTMTPINVMASSVSTRKEKTTAIE